MSQGEGKGRHGLASPRKPRVNLCEGPRLGAGGPRPSRLGSPTPATVPPPHPTPGKCQRSLRKRRSSSTLGRALPSSEPPSVQARGTLSARQSEICLGASLSVGASREMTRQRRLVTRIHPGVEQGQGGLKRARAMAQAGAGRGWRLTGGRGVWLNNALFTHPRPRLPRPRSRSRSQYFLT